MSENKFAKLFELEDGVQVLVWLETNEESSGVDLNLRTDFGDMELVQTLKMPEEVARHKFEVFNVDSAKSYRKRTAGLVAKIT